TLLKIPLLIFGTVLVVKAQTPPNPPPSVGETVKYEALWVPAVRDLGQLILSSFKLTYCAYAACESIAILAACYNTPLSESTLAFLTRDPSTARNVRMTGVWLLGCGFMYAGSIIRLLCYRAMGEHFTWELTVRKGHRLVTGGPYAVVRHPSYVGSAVKYAGLVLAHFGPGSWYAECVGWSTPLSKVFVAASVGWSAMASIMLVARIGREDEVLRKEFGSEWEAYARRTSYRLVPFVY
ncbi:hypothetical protein PHLGIDRAFT_46078, partial [Phlebiopsis gigantea 11061_1 CR5-6]